MYALSHFIIIIYAAIGGLALIGITMQHAEAGTISPLGSRIMVALSSFTITLAMFFGYTQ